MKRRVWLAALLLLAFALAAVFTPVYLIRPFVAQSVSGVSWSYALRQAAPYVSGAVALALIVSLIALWRRSRWIGRTVWIALAAIAVAAAWFARQNHFEWMFRPVQDVRFVPAQEAPGVGTDDLVIGVANGPDALAFPVRRIGYHHIVNTTLGAEPIVATY